MRKVLRMILLVAMAGIAPGAFAQTDSSKFELNIKAGYAYQGMHFLEVGLFGAHHVNAGLRDSNSPQHPWTIYGPAIGTDVRLDFTKPVINPKIGFEFYYTRWLLGARVNVSDYTDFSVSDFRVTPEIGLTAFRLVNATVGYSVPIAGHELTSVSRFRFSFYFNIPTHF